MAIKDNKNGTCTIDYRDKQGKRHRQTIKGSKTLAKEILNKILTELTEKAYFPNRDTNKLTFKQAADKYWELHGSKTRSASKLKYAFNKIVDYFGNKPLANITVEDMQVFYNTMLEKTSGSTANRYFTIVKAIINLMTKLRLYTSLSPCIGVIKKPENPMKTEFLDKEGIKAIVEAASERFRPFLICAITTGLRRGEIMKLDWKDINFKANIIHIHLAKSGKSRELPMCQDARNLFLSLGPKPEGKIFFLTEAMIKRDFKQALLKANLPHIPFHSTRHTFASQFRINNGNLNDLQSMLGHSTIALTMRYAHLSPEYANQSIQCLNGLIPSVEIKPLNEDEIRIRKLNQ